MKKISICVITYNQEDTVRDALNGILAQDIDSPYEVILSDDCSSDGTRNILNEYKVSYPSIFRDVSPERNLGIVPNFLHSLLAAEGDYIACCEGDDYWTDHDKLRKQVAFLEANPDFSMCFHRAHIRDDDELYTAAHCDRVTDREYSSDEIYQEWIIQTATVLFRRNVLDVMSRLNRTEMLRYGDIALFLACAEVGKVWGMSSEMSVYRISGNGVTHNQAFDVNRCIRAIIHERCLQRNFPKLSKSLPDLSIARCYYTLARISPGWWNKIRYAAMSLYYSPSFFAGKAKRFIGGIPRRSDGAGLDKKRLTLP